MLSGMSREFEERVRLDLVPKGDIAQNMFRASFHNWRLNSLSAKPEYPGSMWLTTSNAPRHRYVLTIRTSSRSSIHAYSTVSRRAVVYPTCITQSLR
jgi:hypothetical protein